MCKDRAKFRLPVQETRKLTQVSRMHTRGTTASVQARAARAAPAPPACVPGVNTPQDRGVDRGTGRETARPEREKIGDEAFDLLAEGHSEIRRGGLTLRRILGGQTCAEVLPQELGRQSCAA